MIAVVSRPYSDRVFMKSNAYALQLYFRGLEDRCKLLFICKPLYTAFTLGSTWVQMKKIYIFIYVYNYVCR